MILSVAFGRKKFSYSKVKFPLWRPLVFTEEIANVPAVWVTKVICAIPLPVRESVNVMVAVVAPVFTYV